MVAAAGRGAALGAAPTGAGTIAALALMAADSNITLTIRRAWWLPVYLQTLGFMCRVFQCEPNMAQVSRVLELGTFVRVDDCGREVRMSRLMRRLERAR